VTNQNPSSTCAAQERRVTSKISDEFLSDQPSYFLGRSWPHLAALRSSVAPLFTVKEPWDTKETMLFSQNKEIS